ncbi:MAG: CBS domain-containing protein [Gemmatimonadetes bacterium]|nr:CBS domain-containing protein [Gemmatimonadota bacterium]
MRVRDLMTENPATCTPDTEIPEVARLMAEHDCGVVPVVRDGNRVAGVVTDRDITIRVVARDEIPNTVRVAEVMTEDPVTVSADADVDEAIRTLTEKRLRRVMVTDEHGGIVGVVAQADLARHADPETVGEVVGRVSEPTPTASETTRA